MGRSTNGAATIAALAVLASSAALYAQRKVDDRYPFKAGDIVGFGPNAYPAGATYRVTSCDPVDKPYRECRMIRITPDAETHERPFVMNNYTNQLELLGHAGAPATTAAQPRSAPQPAGRPAPAPQPAQAGGECPKTPYGGRVLGDRPASAALFQQKISDSIAMGSYGRGWYGVKLSNFRVGAAIRNTVTNRPGVGAVRVNTGAPVNAVMYPVSTTMTVCEGWPGGSGSWRTSDKKYLCFVSANNEWTCGASS